MSLGGVVRILKARMFLELSAEEDINVMERSRGPGQKEVDLLSLALA